MLRSKSKSKRSSPDFSFWPIVSKSFFHFRHFPVNSEDTIFLLSAINGAATHLVSYDSHLSDVGLFYDEFVTRTPTAFLIAPRPWPTVGRDPQRFDSNKPHLVFAPPVLSKMPTSLRCFCLTYRQR